MKLECIWSQDGIDNNIWSTSCGEYFTIDDGTPYQNDFKFCYFCGKKLKQGEFKEAE